MNEFTGTKGPWMVYESQSHNESFDYAVVQDYGINGHIAYLTNFANVEPTESNAKLIAAAPDLLQCVQTQLQIIESLIAGNRIVNLDEAISHAKILIDKALGL